MRAVPGEVAIFHSGAGCEFFEARRSCRMVCGASTDRGTITSVAAQSSPGRKQIGQILVAQRWIEPAALARALAEQRHTGKRICSLLIARGLLDPDHAARALANQHNVPGVLQKHLEHRDRSLAELLPAALARATIALPIGRTRNHELLICVRDPKPELAATLAAAVGAPVIIVVAPAHQLEQLVKQVYDSAPRRPGAPGDDEDAIDVDLTTRPIAIIRDLDLFPVLGDPLDHLGTMTLVGLDDVRVAKDPSQSGQHAAIPSRTTTPLPPRTTSAPVIPRTTTPRPLHGPSLDATLTAIGHATTPDDAIDAAMWFLAQRFHHAVWFAIDEGVALGERGHGDGLSPEVIQAIAVPLGAPSIVQLAHDTRALATDLPPGTIQDRLTRTLGTPHTAAAVPIEIDHRVAYVLAVGDASHTPDRAVAELAQLGHALGAAYDRRARRT
jgi:Type II secretion system (T2SS), protein E, N-terminal domain